MACTFNVHCYPYVIRILYIQCTSMCVCLVCANRTLSTELMFDDADLISQYMCVVISIRSSALKKPSAAIADSTDKGKLEFIAREKKRGNLPRALVSLLDKVEAGPCKQLRKRQPTPFPNRYSSLGIEYIQCTFDLCKLVVRLVRGAR